MSACAQIVRGPATRMCGRAANDNAPTRSLVMSSSLGVPAAGVIAAFAMDHALFRLDRQPSGQPRLRRPHDSDYDDLLARVGAEMAQPSA